ncbi:MAG: DUF885 domain-containing protein [Candidatus Eiseniibacteriota bacterium]
MRTPPLSRATVHPSPAGVSLAVGLAALATVLSFAAGLSASSAFVASAASTAAPRLIPPYSPGPGEPAKTAADKSFDRMIDEWFAAELAARPSWATNQGVHAYDTKVEETSASARQARLARAREFRDRARGLEPGHLSPNRRLDQEIFVSRMNALDLDLDVVRSWQRNPSTYSGVVSAGIFALVKRDFAPANDRMRSVNARLAETPRVFRDAKATLENPPQIYTEIAITQTQGLVRFLRDVVPAQLAAADDPKVRAEFKERQATAIQAVEDYIAWMKRDLLPRSKGNYRLGRDTYQKKLLYDEMVATSVDTLLAQGYAALADNHRRMVETARRVDPAKTPQQVLADMAKDHPSNDQLLDATRAGLSKIKQFIADKKICTPPPNQNLIVAETPVFSRSTSFASMDSPGVYEQNANEAYYNVTPVDSAWTDAQKVEHLGFYNKWQLEVVSIHEAFPGHYYQFLHLKNVPSQVRKLMGTGSNSEGWAHYCEEMAIDQGYGGDDPRYTLAMLNLALQRIGRYIVGLEMHVNDWDFERSADFFEKECYMARVNAEREARRGTSDPTYLVYTLGKWEIQKLRDEVQKYEGDQFVLGRFHDRFLEMGRAPLAVIRESFRQQMKGESRVGVRAAGSDIAE